MEIVSKLVFTNSGTDGGSGPLPCFILSEIFCSTSCWSSSSFSRMISLTMASSFKNKWTNDKRLDIFTKYEKDIGGRHISVDLSAPSILQSRVWIPRTLSTLLYSQILYYICHCIEERTKINKRRPGLVTCFKNPHLWKIWKSLRRSVPDDNFVLQIVDLAVFVTVLLKN